MYRRAIFCLLAVFLVTGVVQAAEPSVDELRQNTVEKAIGFLAKQQAADGSFSSYAGIGITSLVTTSLMQHGRTVDDPMVAKSLKFLEQFVRKDGGIHQEETLYRNYETCLAILCFTEANKDGRYTKVIKKADAFVKGLQWTAEEGHDESSNSHGGAGYGKHKRPDLSNTGFLVEALKAAGNDADSDAVKRALRFISRCQNLESEHNTTEFSAKVQDGGFYYTPAAGGSSQAGKNANGGLRSYASMTYVGLKSMIYAGVGPEDKRVKAAMGWIEKNYDLTTNPGMGTSGLFYYYHTFAKALHAAKVETLVDKDGKTHSWKVDLVQELAKRQLEDGSWINSDARWLEGDASLVSAYCLISLSYCK
jgi:squalene-hopene/tetraprenyl-beta-curcumene cyclase